MSTGRVLWVIWCLAWWGVWSVLAAMALGGVASLWQEVLFPAAAVASLAAIALPVGRERKSK